MTPFQKWMSFIAGAFAFVVVVGLSVYGYNHWLPDSAKDRVAAELAQTKAELARLKGTPVDPQAAELARLQKEVADLKAGRTPAVASTAAPAAAGSLPAANPEKRGTASLSVAEKCLESLGLKKEVGEFWSETDSKGTKVKLSTPAAMKLNAVGKLNNAKACTG